MGLGLRYKNEEQIFQEQYTEPPYLEYPMFTRDRDCKAWIFYKDRRRQQRLFFFIEFKFHKRG